MLKKNNLHNYQLKAVNHIINTPKCALFLDMGLGKTTTTLTAIEDLLYDSFELDGKVLIIAPLRVANTVWKQEAQKWEHLKDLTFSIVTGKLADRVSALQKDADIYVINRENIPWLVQYHKTKWRYSMVVIDESSSFKSHSAKRFKALKSRLPKISRVVELTGTPASNGYMDLWSQFYLLDNGQRLGRTITNFRNRFFEADYMGFNYTIRHGAKEQIQKAIQDLTLSMSAEDYLELPSFVPSVMTNKLEGKLLSQYKKFEKEMMVSLTEEDKVTAMTAATLTNKLLQFSSGNVYDEDKNVIHIHDLKIDTLKEIIEENPNDNILVAYNYKHELTSLLQAFPEAVVLDKSGDAVKLWNDGKIKLLLAHPASAGHGLNLQYGGNIMVWYGFTWSLELYQQFNARLYRQGQTEVVRCFHIAVGDVEEKLMKALAQKEITQTELLSKLKENYGKIK